MYSSVQEVPSLVPASYVSLAHSIGSVRVELSSRHEQACSFPRANALGGLLVVVILF